MENKEEKKEITLEKLGILKANLNTEYQNHRNEMVRLEGAMRIVLMMENELKAPVKQDNQKQDIPALQEILKTAKIVPNKEEENGEQD